MRYVVGDIHGGSKTFRTLLRRLDLREGDRLYLLGDYIDRGCDSKGVLDTILSLLDSGYDVRPVRGNHEEMLLRTWSGNYDLYSEYWMKGWGESTLFSFGVNFPENLPEKYLNLLDAMPYVQQDENFIFVHATLDLLTDDPPTQSDPLTMLWGEVRMADTTNLRGRRLVTGHRVRPLADIKKSLQTSIISMDNGAFSGMLPEWGHLVALNLDTMQLTAQPWLDGESEC